jgi:hypothetical protein
MIQVMQILIVQLFLHKELEKNYINFNGIILRISLLCLPHGGVNFSSVPYKIVQCLLQARLATYSLVIICKPWIRFILAWAYLQAL